MATALQPVASDFDGVALEVQRRAQVEEAQEEAAALAAMEVAFEVPAVCRIAERVIKGAIVRTHEELNSRIVKTLAPKSDVVVVHRALNSSGTLRLLIVSPVHGWVSEKLVEHVMKIEDAKGAAGLAEKAKRERIRVDQEQLWRSKGPKVPPSVAISRTLSYFDGVARKLARDPPHEVADPMRDCGPPGELLFKSLAAHKMKRESAVDKMASGLHHGSLRLLELGSGRGKDAVEMTTARVGVDFVGVDGSSAMCDLARRRAEGKRVGFKCEFREQEFFEVAFFGEARGGTFDGALAVDSLRHVPWDLMEACLSKVCRSLTRGGTLVVAEERVAKRKARGTTVFVEDDEKAGPDRFKLSKDGEYTELRTWLEWREKLQKFFVLDKMIDYDVKDRRGRKRTFWAASWLCKANAPDVPPPPNFVDRSRNATVNPAEIDEPVVEDLTGDVDPRPPTSAFKSASERAKDEMWRVCQPCGAGTEEEEEKKKKKPWPEGGPADVDTDDLVVAALKMRGNPSIEECADYVRAKNAFEEAEHKKFPTAPKAPEKQKTVPFGHLRINRDAGPPPPPNDDDELDALDGEFDISGDADALATIAKTKKKKGTFAGGFGRGFLN